MLLLAWRNATRRKNQTITTILITLITVSTFVLAYGIISTLNEGSKLANSRLGADIIVLPHTVQADAFQTLFTADPVNIYMSEQVLNKVKELPGVYLATPHFFAQTLNQSCCSVGDAKRLVGFDWDSDFIVRPWLEGLELTELAPDEVLTGGAVPPLLGGKAVILGDSFWVAGSLETTGTGMDETIFIDINITRQLAKNSPYLQQLWDKELPDHLISAVLIRVEEGVDPLLVADLINSLDTGGNAVAVSKVVRNARDQMDTLTKVLLLLWVAIALIALLGLFGRFNSLAQERKQEIGIYRAIGGKRSEAFGLIIIETLIIVLSGGLTGGLIGVLLVSHTLDWIRGLIQLPQGTWSLTSAFFSVGLGLGVALILGIASALYPAWKSARLDPQETISRGSLD